MNSASGDESLRWRCICGWRRPPHNHNVDAISCPAGIRQGNPGSKYGGLGSARFRAGRRVQRRASAGLRYEGVFGKKAKPLVTAVTHALTDGGAPLRSHARRTGSCAGLPVSISGTTTSLLAGIPELNPGGARLRLLRAHGLFLPFLAILRRSSPSTSPSTAPCRPRRPRSMQLPALRAQRPLEAPPSSPSATTPSTR